MVGCETWPTTNPSPAFAIVATSGPVTGWGSGTVPGHIGTCVCPGEGCQPGVCALRPPHANTTQRAKSQGFITIPTAEYNPIALLPCWVFACEYKMAQESQEQSWPIKHR